LRPLELDSYLLQIASSWAWRTIQIDHDRRKPFEDQSFAWMDCIINVHPRGDAR
jgi:hypothetical protein